MKEAAADGEMVGPGRQDSPAGFLRDHMHILSLGMLLKDINHNDCDSMTGLSRKGRKYIEDHHVPAGKWVREEGAGTRIILKMKPGSSRYDLDKITT